MKLLGNIIWLVFGGILVSIGYLLASIPLMITIIGIPCGFSFNSFWKRYLLNF